MVAGISSGQDDFWINVDFVFGNLDRRIVVYLEREIRVDGKDFLGKGSLFGWLDFPS